jgi:3-oxoacyl-[acyl-carrier protein] reductase
VDIGIADKNALVCASSKGLGKACAISLAREGVNVVLNGRTQATLDQAADEVAAVAAGRVDTVCTDITTPEGRVAALAKFDRIDILINNAGGPPPGDFREWGRDEWLAALNANMLTPIELIKATVDSMIERSFGRIVNITSAAVKAPISFLGLSNGARAGLTGFVAGVARQVAVHNVTINSILPGRFDTDRMRSGVRFNSEQSGVDFTDLFEQGKQNIPVGRYGDPAEFGELCAYLCSDQAGYVTGQNLVIDGGAYPGTL